VRRLIGAVRHPARRLPAKRPGARGGHSGAGVAFAGAGNTVNAVATSTGAILWSYQDTTSGSTFWGAAAISNGQAYCGNQDGNLYAFSG
jgi:outer membrane protein assembly factor BamB